MSDIDVPNVPGVPSLSSYSPNPVVLLFSDAISAVLDFFTGGSQSQWGIFLNGAQAFPYNSVIDFDYKQDNQIADYPVEPSDGTQSVGFQSYDKVQLPFDVRVRVASGGQESDRQALLVAARAASSDLNLYDVVTPEDTYSSCNIAHVDWKRASMNGVGVVVVDFWFQEVRQTATSTFSNTQTPAVAGQQSTGSVAPSDAPASFQDRFSAAGGAT
jgi:hypothetical protein